MRDRLSRSQLAEIKLRSSDPDLRLLVEEIERCWEQFGRIHKMVVAAESSGDLLDASHELMRERAPRYMVNEVGAPRDGAVKEVLKRESEHLMSGHALVVLAPGDASDHIASPRTAQIDRVLIQVGDSVVKGQPLIRLKAPWDLDIDPDAPDAPLGTDEPPPPVPAPEGGWSEF
jgi:acetyl/propionyl-CoA carboxylase alpha subunit